MKKDKNQSIEIAQILELEERFKIIIINMSTSIRKDEYSG